VQDSFNHVKKDFNKVGEWIKHLDDKHTFHKGEIEEIKDTLMEIQKDILELKDFVSFFGPQASKAVFKQPSTDSFGQTDTVGVQTVVQTAVQTGVLENLTVMERAIVWTLLNSDMKLSYEDLAALLGKDKSTIRGQINTLKQKSEGLIEESRETTGKKRLHISEKAKENLLKSLKVKVKKEERGKNKKREN